MRDKLAQNCKLRPLLGRRCHPQRDSFAQSRRRGRVFSLRQCYRWKSVQKWVFLDFANCHQLLEKHASLHDSPIRARTTGSVQIVNKIQVLPRRPGRDRGHSWRRSIQRPNSDVITRRPKTSIAKNAQYSLSQRYRNGQECVSLAEDQKFGSCASWLLLAFLVNSTQYR